jgi:hypothetical protein
MNTTARTLLLAATSLLSGSVAAETYTVHPTPGVGDFTSPSRALASPLVSSGDLILVMPGTYAGKLVVGKAVTLESTDGAAVTILDGAGRGPVVELAVGATVRGFTITGAGGTASIGGVLVSSTATAVLERNVIAENHPLGDVAIPTGGVMLGSGASAVLRWNDIHSNTSLSVGGVFTAEHSTLEMVGNRVRGNGPSTIGGMLLGGSGRLVNVQVTGNKGIGAGIYVDAAIGPDPWGATIEITNCTIAGNFGSGAPSTIGGLFLDNGGGVTVRNTILHSNLGSPGGDLYLSPDFLTGPVEGYIDLDYSHVGTLGSGVMPGMHMVPSIVDPGFVAPIPAFLAPTLLGDYHLMPVSLDLHAGLDAAFPSDLPAFDLVAGSRFRGPAVDLGVFEHGLLKARIR